MKVYFDNADISGLNTNGPHSFAHRLAKQFTLMGIELSESYEDYDVALVTIEHSNRLNFRKPFVQRLDGIWSKPEEFQTKNIRMRECYYSASGVIFQSNFDKKMISKWFGRHKNSEVIHNGIELEHVKNFSEGVLKLRETYKKIFVCSASWHPQKRLHENVKLYRTIRDNFDDYKDSCLIVLGPNPTMDKFCIRDNIFYTGHQSQEVCKQVFAAADFMIHLSYVDHCPNVVLESLSQETPVICTNSGGTSELLIGNENNKNGLVLDDVVFNFELSDYDNPPSIPDYDIKKLETFLTSKIVIENNHLDIKLCAEKYISMFKNVLSSL